MARKSAAQIKAEAEATVKFVETTGLTDALFKLQGVMPAFQTDEVNPHLHNKYLSVNTLMPKLLVLLRAHGLLLVQSVSNVGGAGSLETELVHVATGESRVSEMLLAADKQTPQGQGSAITYARRYALVSLLGLVIEKDDDGNAASRFREAADLPLAPATVVEGTHAHLVTPAAGGFATPSGFGAAL